MLRNGALKLADIASGDAGAIAASVCAPFLPPLLQKHVLSANVEGVLESVGCDWQARPQSTPNLPSTNTR